MRVLPHVSASVADQVAADDPCFSSLSKLLRTVLLSGDVAGSLDSLVSCAPPRSQIYTLLANLCSCGGLFLPSTSQRIVLGEGKIRRMLGHRRETSRGHATRRPAGNGLEAPARAAERKRVPATPR